jgi:L-asparagine transporter-like permease
MAMVGVGGSIGTGILLGSGAAIQIAGPADILSLAASNVCPLQSAAKRSSSAVC